MVFLEKFLYLSVHFWFLSLERPKSKFYNLLKTNELNILL